MNRSQSKTGRLAGLLELKIDARIMVTVNNDLDDRLVNGQLGTVKHILKDKMDRVTKIYVAFNDNQAGSKNMSKDSFASHNLCVAVEREKTNLKIRWNKDTSPVINRTQFPLKLAWGCSENNAQCIILEDVVISIDLLRQRNFNCCQMYLALNRVTSLNSLYLIGQFNLAAIKEDLRASNEY